jgi:hypothetical protein
MDDDYGPTLISEKVLVTAIGQTQILCEANPRRIALFMSCNQGQTFVATQPGTLGPHGAGALAGGFVLGTQMFAIISKKLHGYLCTTEWWGSSPNAADVVTVIEVLKP